MAANQHDTVATSFACAHVRRVLSASGDASHALRVARLYLQKLRRVAETIATLHEDTDPLFAWHGRMDAFADPVAIVAAEIAAAREIVSGLATGDTRVLEMPEPTDTNVDPYALTDDQWEALYIAGKSGALQSRGLDIAAPGRGPLLMRPPGAVLLVPTALGWQALRVMPDTHPRSCVARALVLMHERGSSDAAA